MRTPATARVSASAVGGFGVTCRLAAESRRTDEGRVPMCARVFLATLDLGLVISLASHLCLDAKHNSA